MKIYTQFEMGQWNKTQILYQFCCWRVTFEYVLFNKCA